MRISDWSSDVCSSDLADVLAVHRLNPTPSEERKSAPAGRSAGGAVSSSLDDLGDDAGADGAAAIADREAQAFVHGDRCDQLQVHCDVVARSEEHTSELQSLNSNSYAVFCL